MGGFDCCPITRRLELLTDDVRSHPCRFLTLADRLPYQVYLAPALLLGVPPHQSSTGDCRVFLFRPDGRGLSEGRLTTPHGSFELDGRTGRTVGSFAVAPGRMKAQVHKHDTQVAVSAPQKGLFRSSSKLVLIEKRLAPEKIPQVWTRIPVLPISDTADLFVRL